MAFQAQPVPVCKLAGAAGYVALQALGWICPKALSFAHGWPALAWTLLMGVLTCLPMARPAINATGAAIMSVLCIIRTMFPDMWRVLFGSWIGLVLGMAGIIMALGTFPSGKPQHTP